MRLDDGTERQDRLVTVARQALRWVTDAAVTTDDGATWPLTRAPGAPLADDLYDGSAGVLIALAEAHLTGVTDFDDQAGAAAGRVRCQAEAMLDSWPARAPNGAAGHGQEPDPGLYTGLGGAMMALDIWAQASGDRQARAAARALAARLAPIAQAAHPVSSWRDLLSGEAGVLLALTAFGGQAAGGGAARIADRLVAEACWIDGLPDWYPRADDPVFQPNMCHGLAGIAFALAAASEPLGRAELLDIAQRAARRLIQLGSQPDGTLVVPHSIPLADPQAPVSFGWCHGPTGTLRLFQILDRVQPGHGWAWAQACRLAVRRSGLPARRYPGFWDNLGQCCGTAGVGEMALDRYQESADRQWLAWADELADDVLARCITDKSGVRWSHTEHRLRPQELEPAVGWMQGAAGIAGWLLRLARVRRDGVGAARTSWPDRP